eukprot:11206249-Lingulodinium_polyedra.AAC.1
MPPYIAKTAKRKGQKWQGADERFLNGEWDLTACTGDELNSINHSSPVLSGGKALQRHAQTLAKRRKPEDNQRWQDARRRKRRERQARRTLNPKLPGTARPRLPESLRV